ncbi:MAG: glycoside hydrolase family 2 [Hamadaea sp.]|uniref:glycoside hydrolase family 2 protein n=1 Tax=Hamadaea sp. TaxID=2024425 RepID=UPI0017FF14D2|nr:glycoside hydrolase family 2 TIM barrel-domain containing protein [Hamadaea sp.]NUR73861.1 glycoside hydrolase family 2 [Hamadaea sp.]NUT18974.1 glycoside hydrolase family 2 [Hamadaea sp.]
MTTPRPEYPRPHFDRSAAWLSLNGTWDFSEEPSADSQADWGTVIVPFPWEHPASGVGRHWQSVGWYRREIRRPAEWAGQRTILHFGAVHHRAEVWVNDVPVVSHEGGYLPFEADITDALDTAGAGVLVVRVEAPVDKLRIPHGKQRSLPADDYDGCAFGASSGIWQPVWLEPRPATHLVRLDLTPTPDLDGIEVILALAGPEADAATITLAWADQTVTVDDPASPITLPIAEPRLWTVEDPHLYFVTATVTSPSGVDTVTAYAGLRSVGWHDRLLHLNGVPVFLRGVLDQGFWPEGGHTAPDDDAFRRDLELAKAAGFNLVRKHLKAEDPRWLYWADRLGVLVWAEPASTGRFHADAVAAFEDGLTGMIRRDRNHPSIVIWGAYNEEWGLDWDVPGDTAKQDAVRRAYKLVKDLDLTRPVVDNSGWTHVETDLVDWHYYDDDAVSWARTLTRLVSGADPGFPVRLGPDHVVTKLINVPGFDESGRPWLNGEYGGGATSVERGWHQRWQTQELRRHERVAGYIYTELYDIEHETVGVYTYDRRTKDLGGVDPADVHADTVLIADVEPQRPGRDLVVAGPTQIAVRVSHHGGEAVDGTLRLAWTPRFGDAPAPGSPAWQTTGTSTHVKPYQLSEPVTVLVNLPDGWADGRLHLLFEAAGRTAARTAIDVVVDSAPAD